MHINIVSKIFNKLGGTVKHLVIKDVLVEVAEYIKDEVSANRAFSVKNFGTFDTLLIKSHVYVSIKSRKREISPEVKRLRLIPHNAFKILANRRLQRRHLEEQQDQALAEVSKKDEGGTLT